jgi:hypothetical protein
VDDIPGKTVDKEVDERIANYTRTNEWLGFWQDFGLRVAERELWEKAAQGKKAANSRWENKSQRERLDRPPRRKKLPSA